MNDTAVHVGLRYAPRKWQLELHEAMATFQEVACIAHRRSGKSVAAAAALCMAALAVPGRYGLGSTTKTQLKLIYWQIFRDFLADIPGVTFHEGEVKITFSNGSDILFFGLQEGDGQSVRGTGLRGFVLDEAQLVPEAALTGAVKPALTDHEGWLLVIGTPNEPSLLGQYYGHVTTSGDPNSCGLHFPVDKTDVFSPAEIEKLKEGALNLHFYKQEYECLLDAQAENKLLSLPAILAAIKRTAPPKLGRRRDNPVIIAVDVGGEGLEADQSAICVREGPNVLSLEVVPPAQLDNLPLLVAATMRDFGGDVLLVDGTGGHASALTYRLGELGYNVIPVVFSARASRDDLHANRRAEMYAKLASFLRREDVTLPADRALIKELAAIAYRHDTKGRLLLEPKDKVRQVIGHSPDRSDSLAMSMLGDLMAPAKRSPTFTAPGKSLLCGGREPGAKFQSDYQRLRHLRNNDRVYDPHLPSRTYDPFD